MRTLLASAAIASLAVLGPAQNTNEQAPTASNSLSFEDGSAIAIAYRSFTVAGGNWLNALHDQGERGQRTRKFYNEQYITGFLKGSLKLATDMTLGGNPVAKGEYGFTFRIDDDLVWHLVVLDGDEEVAKIALETESDENDRSARLVITPIAAAEGSKGHIKIHFGPLQAKVDFAAGSQAEEASAGKDK